MLSSILSLSPRGLICKKRDTPGVSSINLSLSLSPPNPKQKPSAPRQRTPARKGYKVWTEPEKVALTAGVAKYGPGNFLLFFVVEKGCFLLYFLKPFFFRSLLRRARKESVSSFAFAKSKPTGDAGERCGREGFSSSIVVYVVVIIFRSRQKREESPIIFPLYFLFFLRRTKRKQTANFFFKESLFLTKNSHKKMSLLIYVKANGRKSWTTRRLARN